MAFQSEYNHTIDPKGRLIIPTKYRCELGTTFVVTRGIDKCLYLYPLKTWEKVEEELDKIPTTSHDGRMLVRYLEGGATQVDMDSQGRILIPTFLREHAKLNKDVVLVGAVKRIELWSKESFVENNSYDNMDAIAEGLNELSVNLNIKF